MQEASREVADLESVHKEVYILFFYCLLTVLCLLIIFFNSLKCIIYLCIIMISIYQ